MIQTVGEYGEGVQRKCIMLVWGTAFNRVPGQSPWSWGSFLSKLTALCSRVSQEWLNKFIYIEFYSLSSGSSGSCSKENYCHQFGVDDGGAVIQALGEYGEGVQRKCIMLVWGTAFNSKNG